MIKSLNKSFKSVTSSCLNVSNINSSSKSNFTDKAISAKLLRQAKENSEILEVFHYFDVSVKDTREKKIE